MIETEKDLYIILKDEENSIDNYLSYLHSREEQLTKVNVVLDLEEVENLSPSQLLDFLPLSKSHRSKNKSFVIVTSDVGVDDVPEELIIVPTIVEAEDLIQMEEIERDLGF